MKNTLINYLNPYEACVNLKCPDIDKWFEDYLDDNDDNNVGKLYDKCEAWIVENYSEVIFSRFTTEVVINPSSKK